MIASNDPPKYLPLGDHRHFDALHFQVCLTNWVFEADKVKGNSRSGHCDSRHQKEPQVQSSISGPQAAKYQDTREKLANGTVFDDFLDSSWPHHPYLELKVERAQVERSPIKQHATFRMKGKTPIGGKGPYLSHQIVCCRSDFASYRTEQEMHNI
jgi:hypothetical protein